MTESANVNPWVVQQPKQTAQVPVGFYTGAFRGVEEVKLQDGSAKWRWSWEVGSGPEKGKLATALTDRSISPAALPGVLIAGLLGRTIQPGEDGKASVDGCKGKTYLVSVQAGPKGGKPCVRTVGTPPAM